MTIERFNPPASTQRILAVALMILALITFVGSSALAEPPETERRIIPVTIKKGENYTISDVKKDEGAPASKVVTCPAKAYQVEVEETACVVRLRPVWPAFFALNGLK